MKKTLRIQDRLLNMAIKVRDILESHTIPYFITFGTLLGAVRHRGFIPWDEDLDFFLFEETYQKAIDFLIQELPADMFLENEQTEHYYFHGWAHVKDCNTICENSQFPQDSIYSHKGISIDLYKMEEIKACDWPEFKYREAVKYLDRRLKNGFLSPQEYKEKERTYCNQMHSMKENMTSNNQRVFASSASKHIFVKEWILPLSKIEFEKEIFYAPNNPDAFLKECYGNYMQLPPDNLRTGQYTKVAFL